MQKKFVLKSVKALKKVAALGAGLTMLGATLTGALAVDLGDYPAPFVNTNGVYNDANTFVAGANAAASDTLGLVDISTNLQYMAKKPVSSSTTSVEVIGGESKEIVLGKAIADTSKTNFFDATVKNAKITSLFDGKIRFDTKEFKTEEVLVFNSNGPTIQTGVDDTDYEDNVYMEVASRDLVAYQYKFKESVTKNISLAAANNLLEIDFLGKPLSIYGVTDTTISAFVGEQYQLTEQESVVVDGKTVTLTGVGSDSVFVNVDGEDKDISSTAGSSQTFADGELEVAVKTTFVKTNLGESQAILVIGEKAAATYTDGDAYVGEDDDDPDWVWWIADLTKATHTAADAKLGVRNEFRKYRLDDNPIAMGECIDLPNDYLSVCLNSLTIDDDSYMSVKMEVRRDDAGTYSGLGTAWNDKYLLEVTAGESEGFYLQTVTNGVINYTSDKYVDKVFFHVNDTSTVAADSTNLTGSPSQVLDIFFADPDDSNRLKYWGSHNATGDFASVLELNYGDTKGSDVVLKYLAPSASATGKFNLTWDVGTKYGTDIANGEDDIATYWSLSSTAMNSLGATADSAEAGELAWGSSTSGYGTKDVDLRTHYGIIIKNPDSNGDSDTVELHIPSDEVYANVVLKGTDTTTVSGGSSYVPTEVNPKTMLDSEVSDPTAYNLILVGGPCANTLVESVFGIACADWPYDEGEALVKIVENGDNVAMLVAGTTALDTRRACKAVGSYEDHALSGSEVLVKGTTISDITVETPSAE